MVPYLEYVVESPHIQCGANLVQGWIPLFGTDGNWETAFMNLVNLGIS